MKRIHIKVTFIDDLLGSANSNPEIHSEFIASKAPDAKTREEEVAAVGAAEVAEKTTTIFPRNKDGMPIMYGYQMNGFFKEACKALRAMTGEKCAKESIALKAYKQRIDLEFRVYGDADFTEKEIVIHTDDAIGTCQRPLRAETMQGARVALASSEQISKGAWCEMYIRCPDIREKVVKEWLDYGRYHGMLQWRNSGKGAFTYELIDITDC